MINNSVLVTLIRFFLLLERFEPLQNSDLKPFDFSLFLWWSIRDLNPWPLDCQSSALPTELMPQDVYILAYFNIKDKEIRSLLDLNRVKKKESASLRKALPCFIFSC